MSETATLDAVRANADAVSQLIDQNLPGSPQEVVNFVRYLWTLNRKVWDAFQARLDQGLDAGQARHAAACASLACESLLRVVALLEAALPHGNVDGLAELLAAVPQIREIQRAARHIVDLLNSPAPPIDEGRMAQGLAAVVRGDFEDTATIIERLKAGGEL